MSTIDDVLKRYERAMNDWADLSSRDVELLYAWQSNHAAEFRTLRYLLIAHAEAGDMRCQYALATLFWFGLAEDCKTEEFETEEFETEEEMFASHDQAAALVAATRWWVAAAEQGCWPALDNLLTSGIGPEAEHARVVAKEVERERPELVPWSHNMPIYGPDYMREVCRRTYGKADTEIYCISGPDLNVYSDETDNGNEPMEAATYETNWVKCPNCGWRFCLEYATRSGEWPVHPKCGQRLKINVT